ncbi:MULTISPECIES: MgtC/SapB family protein [Delftia]|jgi:putative Mg2+ transporter-C (MgtC) family protein|uniref:Protein MgtC n=4 Tax=Delftia TaxID=80865 RepID=A9C102_DELAS|nr:MULTISPECIES: MgtC/SapB family protein [Delftia]MCP4015014.1 MgtC/SapB family protein [Delftia sp.]OLE94381.1 MAG: methyltransferase [Delftia sp. 13_1_40CM_3_66_6]PIF35675.1 putative Mg2+ transporter-C (MgtC) family protein [Burkholderiales bacterium 23]ABX38465.1 MgtC/SapB transporter [Delftia acidovorans SPH-1]AEF87800.1 MgtC/SapB transporter [Delftia sp. Cs1-4]
MWEEVTSTLAEEFSSLPDAAEVTRVMVRLLLAALLGGIVGYEREHKGKAAGLRTHMLVAMGAALFVLVPERGGMGIADMSRVIQGVVAGVGFLGAGAIIKRHSEEQVQGLTTAAGIWMTAAIGVACGLGREAIALLATLLAIVILVMLPHVVSAPPPQADAEPDTKPRET